MKNKKNTVLIKIMASTALSTALIMILFEVVKQQIHANLTLWESHIATIIFTTAMSALLTLFALKRHYSLARILNGLIPMCAWCNRIRDENGDWVSIGSYFESYSNAEITHGICSECSITLKEKLRKSKELKSNLHA